MPYDTAAIRTLLLAAFGDVDFETFCYDHYREVSNDFTDGQGQSARVQTLLEYVERREGIGRLLELVKQERPEKYKVYQISDTIATARKMVESKWGTFQAVLNKIDVITDYKTLHDCLHYLHYKLFRLIEQSLRKLEEDKNARSDLKRYDLDFQPKIEEMRGALSRKNVDPAKVEWVEPLDQARKQLKKGLADSDGEQINNAEQAIRSILQTELSLINKELVAAMRGENQRLPRLIEVMEDVCEKLESAGPEAVGKYKKGLALFRDMRSSLDALVNEHDAWQYVDDTLPMLRELLDDDMSAFSKPWLRLKTRAAPFYSGRADEWAVDFRTEEENLEREVAAKNLDAARDAFSLYWDRASARFYDVDEELLEFCTSLQAIREYLP